MGKTKRHEQTDGHRFKKLRGQTSKRKDRKNKATLSNFISFRSQRHVPHQPNEETLAAMNELEGHEPMDCLGFDTVEELLGELHEPDDKEEL